MKTVTLQILKEDILTSNYYNSDSCPITKALKRANINAVDTGTCINPKNNEEIDFEKNLTNYDKKDYKELVCKVIGMYIAEGIIDDDDNERIIQPAADFEHTLELDID